MKGKVMSIGAGILNIVFLLVFFYYLGKDGLPEPEHLPALVIILLCPVINLIALMCGLRNRKELQEKIKSSHHMHRDKACCEAEIRFAASSVELH